MMTPQLTTPTQAIAIGDRFLTGAGNVYRVVSTDDTRVIPFVGLERIGCVHDDEGLCYIGAALWDQGMVYHWASCGLNDARRIDRPEGA